MGGEKKIERATWSGNCEVLLSYIGYCVGLGNIWRFPYLCYRNGGGAFLIPYFLVLILAGIPIYFLEIALGQYSSSSASTVWRFCPLFKGVGYCMVVMCTYCCVYYNMLVAYSLRFLVASMTTLLPWSTCDNDWNTPNCRSMDYKHSPVPENATDIQLELYNTTKTMVALGNVSLTNGSILVPASNWSELASPAAEYWEYRLLGLSSGIEDLGPIQWELAVSLFVAWVLIFLCLVKGIQSTGKVVYVTATFPYVVILILLIRGVTLPGSLDGILWYIVPDFSQLKNTKVWGDAASQIFYSLGQAWGILITYGSYNKFNHNSARDTLIACGMCAFTSLVSGFVVFSVIGFLAHELNAPIDEVMTSGPGLAFVVYPEALARMPVAPMWAIIFFLMLLTVSVDSMFATFEAVVSAFVDEFPSQLMKHKTLFTAFCAAVMFLMGLPLTCKGGMYVLTLMDWYSATFPPLIVAVLETVLVCHVYGWRRFSRDIEIMMGFRPNIYWLVCWIGVTPVVVLAITFFNAFVYAPVSYGSYSYPVWAEGLGWVFCASSLICIPIFMPIQMYRRAGGFRNLITKPLETLRDLLTPDDSWVPNHLREEKRSLDQELEDVSFIKPMQDKPTSETQHTLLVHDEPEVVTKKF